MSLSNPNTHHEAKYTNASVPSPVSSPVFINPITLTVTNNNNAASNVASNATYNVVSLSSTFDNEHSYDEYNYATTTSAQIDYSQPIEAFYHIGRTWSSYYSDEGYLYFLDANSEHSQWEDPRTHGFILQITTDDLSASRPLSPPKCPSPKVRSPAAYNNYSNNFSFDDEKLSVSKQLFIHNDDDVKRGSKDANSKEDVDEKHTNLPPPMPTGSKGTGDVAVMLSLLQKFNLDVNVPSKAEEKKDADDASSVNGAKDHDSKAESNVLKYQKMVSLGCGLDSVVNKMKSDGVETHLIDQFYRENTENIAV